MTIGRHDPFGADQRILLQIGCDAANPALDEVDWKWNADHARRADEHIVRRRAKLGRRRRRHPPHIRDSDCTRRNVTDLAVHHDRPEAPGLNDLSAHDHRCARKVVTSEYRGGRGIDIAREDREISRLWLEADVPARTSKPARKNGTIVESDRGHGLSWSGTLRSAKIRDPGAGVIPSRQARN